MATDIGRRWNFGTCSTVATDSSSPATTRMALGSGAGGSFIHTSARMPCHTRDHTDASNTVDRRKPVSLFFRLVPYRTLKWPVYHHVRAANNNTPERNDPT